MNAEKRDQREALAEQMRTKSEVERKLREEERDAALEELTKIEEELRVGIDLDGNCLLSKIDARCRHLRRWRNMSESYRRAAC